MRFGEVEYRRRGRIGRSGALEKPKRLRRIAIRQRDQSERIERGGVMGVSADHLLEKRPCIRVPAGPSCLARSLHQVRNRHRIPVKAVRAATQGEG